MFNPTFIIFCSLCEESSMENRFKLYFPQQGKDLKDHVFQGTKLNWCSFEEHQATVRQHDPYKNPLKEGSSQATNG